MFEESISPSTREMAIPIKAPLEPQKLFLTSVRESRYERDFGLFSVGESRTWTLFCLV